MRRSLLLTAAGFAAGLALGYALRPAPAADRAARPASVVAPEAQRREAATNDLHEQLMALPVPELPEGEGTILGHVRDDEGAPLEGVLIVAALVLEGPPQKSRKGAAAPQDRDLDDMVREMVWTERGRRESRRTARSGADGSYELTGVADAKWQLRAYKEGYELRPYRSSAYNVEPGATVDFVGDSIVRIDVDVLMPDGSRPPRAQIRAASQRASSSMVSSEQWLPEERWIELKPNAYELTAEVQGARYLRSQPQTLNVEAGAVLSLVFRLENRPALSVRVVAPDGIRLPQWAAWAMRFAGEKPPDPARLRSEGMNGTGHGMGERGVVWQDIAAGSYLVGAAYSSNSPVVTTQVVQVGAGTTEIDLRFPALDPEDFLAVRVRDPDGAPPRGVRFHLGRSARSMGTATTLEREDGACLLLRDGDETGSLFTGSGCR
jgi:hypothetical protein